MAIKIPLVLGDDGGIERLQDGDEIEAGLSEQRFDATNANAGAITQGQPVYISGDMVVDLAQADAKATANVIGLVRDETIATTEIGAILTDGVLEVADWTAVTGTEFLTVGNEYFLSPTTAGALTTTVPEIAGQVNAYIGRAISTTALEISIARPILL